MPLAPTGTGAARRARRLPSHPARVRCRYGTFHARPGWCRIRVKSLFIGGMCKWRAPVMRYWCWRLRTHRVFISRWLILTSLLRQDSGSSFCEWKGPASYWSLKDGARNLPGVAWSYPKPLAGAEPIANCIAFYPANLTCTVGGAKVTPQPGGFYGGWITPELVGPFKGEAGTQGW